MFCFYRKIMKVSDPAFSTNKTIKYLKYFLADNLLHHLLKATCCLWQTVSQERNIEVVPKNNFLCK